ncbi:MAG: arginine--tRNA ligase, partial [Alphaproteobacteria bacterium]|nr:arginine--tRNA ligase [Alphaproteobacteria bacterium]
LSEAMAGAQDKRAPNILCDYVFELAQRFSRVYAARHILAEEDRAVRVARLELARMTLAMLIYVLDLLGIEVPARM